MESLCAIESFPVKTNTVCEVVECPAIDREVAGSKSHRPRNIVPCNIDMFGPRDVGTMLMVHIQFLGPTSTIHIGPM